MKRTIAISILVLGIFSCSTEARNDTTAMNSGISMLCRYEMDIKGMHFVLFRDLNGGLVSINSTKDSLEIEYYKQQLNKK